MVNQRFLIYYLQKDFDNAIKAYSKAIKINPSYAYALNDRGSCFRALEDYENAVADYLEASKHDPQAFVFNNLASAYRKSGDKDQAIGFLVETSPSLFVVKVSRRTKFFMDKVVDGNDKGCSSVYEVLTSGTQPVLNRMNDVKIGSLESFVPFRLNQK